MVNKQESFFNWGNGVIPGRKVSTGERIVIYNSSIPNILASELGITKPFAIPETWRQEADEFIVSLLRPKKQIKTIVFDAIKTNKSMSQTPRAKAV